MNETGLPNPFTMTKQYAWEAWLTHRWEAPELKLVIAHLKRKIARGQKWESALAFRNLIEDPEKFAEALSEAVAHSRQHKLNPNKASVLRATGREERSVPIPIARSAGDVLRGDEALAALLKCRDSL